MRRRVWILVSLLVLAFVPSAVTQEPNGRQGRGGQAGRGGQGQENEGAALPDDRRLLALHRSFITNAEKLALEYERERDLDKAKAVYGEILKLVPQYEAAQAKLEAIRQMEANAGRATFKVRADRPWQDTGITLVPGKPIAMRANGAWTFQFKAELTAEGISIPQELREFNLGSLVGYVETGDPETSKPFVIGPEKSWVPTAGGRLFLQMYDNDTRDNQGELTVEFLGTFEQR